ncbi:MAG: hypothetical protein Q4E38_08485 [Eubacteriales bacterium]|nr:hypothetical protein [Eubacteriales bacterium]
MAKQQSCLAARQSRAAKSFMAFRYHIVIIGGLDEKSNRHLKEKRKDGDQKAAPHAACGKRIFPLYLFGEKDYNKAEKQNTRRTIP